MLSKQFTTKIDIIKKMNERHPGINSQENNKNTIETVEEFIREFHNHFNYEKDPMSLERISQIIDELYKYKHWMEIESMISIFQTFTKEYQIKSQHVQQFIDDKILRLKYYRGKNKFLSNKERVNKKLLDVIEPFKDCVEVEKVGEESDKPPFENL